MTKKSMSLEIDPSIMETNMRIVKENPMEEELNKLFSFPDTVPSKLVKPTPGFCVKTLSKPDGKKVFVNICVTDAIPCPEDITNDQLMKILSSSDPSSYRVPMSIGEGRTELDKSGAPATVYDVAVNPKFFNKVKEDDLFQTFFLTVVFEGLQDKYQFEIESQKYSILKNRKSMGTLQAHRIQIRDIIKCEVQNKLLIEEITNAKPYEQKISGTAAQNNKEVIYRLRREPPTGEIQYLLAEFRIPATVELKDLHLEIGEDRLVLDSKGKFDTIDFFLPCSVDQDVVDAKLNRNNDILSVKMPAID